MSEDISSITRLPMPHNKIHISTCRINTFSRNDVKRVRDVVTMMTDHAIVVERRDRNVCRRGIDLSHEIVWKRQIGCLLTTQQKSSADSAVQRFIRSNSPLLLLNQCKEAKDIVRLAESEFYAFGGIRRTTVISKQIAHNFRWLNGGGWANSILC